MKLHRLLCALALTTLAAGASAQNLAPGLWEITSTTSSASGGAEKAAAGMEAEMAGLPPEQRKMVEDMMAKQGVKLGAGGPGEMVVKVCLTPEMVERNELPAQQGKCKSTAKPRSGNTLKMTFACTDPPSSGEGEYTIASPESYTSKMTVRTTAQGRPETMTIGARGRWVGADCGGVKPTRSAASRD